MRLRLREADLFLRDCRARLPFRFGVTTMTRAPLAMLKVVIETDERETASGFASDLLVPKWFKKNPHSSIEDDTRALTESVKEAARLAEESAQFLSVFDLWRELYRARVESQPRGAFDLLVRGFGVAMVERAVIDALCRASDTSFFDALRTGLFGCDTSHLQLTPPRSMHVRHTVGLADALMRGEIPSEDRISDGLPESLEEDIEAYGLRFFKIKISGERERDLDRLTRIARILNPVREPRITLDGNEQFESIADLLALLEALGSREEGRFLLSRLLLIEQPLSRAHTFDPDRNEGIDQVSSISPVIIDEADMSIDSFERAADLGYRGVSIKNCKGVFRAIMNHRVCRELDQRAGRAIFIQSGEDLTNLPVIALQQDLATQHALGMTHVERNGHHYFRGLDHLPESERQQALRAHPDLYESRDAGTFLRIENGRVSIESLDCPGYGHAIEPEIDAWNRV